MINDDPIKPRKKYVEVPIHKPEKNQLDNPKIKKTYSANFSSRKHRRKHGNHDNTSGQKISEVIIEIPEKDSSYKIEKKGLCKEIERLNRENEEIAAKFNELEDLSVKKILKLKEKVNNLQNINLDLNKDAETMKDQYYELAKCYEDVKNQFELCKICKNCEELREQVKKMYDQNNALKKQNNEVKEDLNMMKTVVFRKSEAKYLDLEHSLNEIKVSRSACRKQLHKAMCFAKDMVAEQETLLRALNQRQLENRAVKKIGTDMAVRMDSLKTQLKDVQKSAWQEFSTVEQKIQEQADLIETMQEDHKNEIENLQKIIAEQEEKLSKQKKDANIPLSHYHLFKEKYK